jgi:hypothetical protein
LIWIVESGVPSGPGYQSKVEVVVAMARLALNPAASPSLIFFKTHHPIGDPARVTSIILFAIATVVINSNSYS